MAALHSEDVRLPVDQPEGLQQFSSPTPRGGDTEAWLRDQADRPRAATDERASVSGRSLPVLRQLSIDKPPKDHVLALGRNTVGRHPENNVVLSSWFVSRWHCVILVYSNGRCLIEDLGSTYGVHVNGERIGAQMPLRYGDEIRVGAQRLVLLLSENGTAWTELKE